MSTTNKALEVLQETLKNLETSLNGRTSDIRKQYSEAEKIANNNYKKALAIAVKTRDEGLADFKNDKEEIAKLKNAIKALKGEPTKEKLKKSKIRPIPTSIEDLKSNNDKITFVVKLLERATNNEIKYKLAELGIGFKSNIGDITGKLEAIGILASERIEGKKFYFIKI